MADPALSSIAVIGAGAWGTALAAHLSRRADLAVTLWARDRAQARSIATRRVNERYLPGCPLPESLVVSGAIADVANADLLVVATPAAALPAVAGELAAAGASAPLVWLSKGFLAVPVTVAHPAGVALPHQMLGPA